MLSKPKDLIHCMIIKIQAFESCQRQPIAYFIFFDIFTKFDKNKQPNNFLILNLYSIQDYIINKLKYKSTCSDQNSQLLNKSMSAKSQMGQVPPTRKTNQDYVKKSRPSGDCYRQNLSNTQRTQSSSITQQKSTKSKTRLTDNASVRKAVNIEQPGNRDYIVNTDSYNGLIFDKANKSNTIHPASMKKTQKQQRVPLWQLSPMNNVPKYPNLSKNEGLEHYLAYSDEDSRPQDSFYAFKSNLKNHKVYHKNIKQKTSDQLMSTLTSLQAQNMQLKRQNQSLCNQLQQTRQENSELLEYITRKNNQIKGMKGQNNSLNYPQNYNMNELQIQRGQLLQSKKLVEDNEFVRQCSLQIQHLKDLVRKLVQEKGIPQPSPSEREQIKDRIILKLEDELITAKLLLNEQKAVYLKHRSIVSELKPQPAEQHQHMNHHLHQHISQPLNQHHTYSNSRGGTIHQNISARNQYQFQGEGQNKLFYHYN